MGRAAGGCSGTWVLILAVLTSMWPNSSCMCGCRSPPAGGGSIARPIRGGLGVLAGEGEGERHSAVTGGQVMVVPGLCSLQVGAQGAFRRLGQHRAADLWAFAVAGDTRQLRATIWVAGPAPGP